MRRFLVFMAAAAMPFLAFAAIDTSNIDFTDVTGRYGDAPFSQAETAAISVLTTMGVVEGDPTGNFVPGRDLNRAEFTKIAMLLSGASMDGVEGKDCFPDVKVTDWFSKYVCLAKEDGAIQGYDDGLFRPSQSVTNAEGVKILASLFEYALSPQDGDDWFEPFMRAASARGVSLPGSILPHDYLTRGQMARLAAAFAAERQGRLGDYRLAERGKWTAESVATQDSSRATGSGGSAGSNGSSTIVTGTNGSAGSAGSAASAGSAVSMASSASVAFSLPSFGQASSSSSSQKPTFQFMYAGQPTPPLYVTTVKNPDEDSRVTSAELKLWNDMASMQAVYLVDGSGTTVGMLEQIVQDSDHDNRDEYDTWRGTFGTGALIPRNTPRTYSIRALMKSGEFVNSGEVFDPRYLTIYSRGVSGQARQMLIVTEEQVRHIAVRGAVTGVRNALDVAGTLQPGANKLIAMFTFTGTGASTAVEEVELRARLVDVTLTHMTIGDDVTRGECSSSNADRTLFTCIVPASIGKVTSAPRSYSVRADVAVALSGKNPTAQLIIEKAGAIDSGGSVRWTDGSWHFRLLQSGSPVAEGPLWHVVP